MSRCVTYVMHRYIKQVIQVIQMCNICDVSAIQVIQVRDSATPESLHVTNVPACMLLYRCVMHRYVMHRCVIYFMHRCVNLDMSLVGAAWSHSEYLSGRIMGLNNCRASKPPEASWAGFWAPGASWAGFLLPRRYQGESRETQGKQTLQSVQFSCSI